MSNHRSDDNGYNGHDGEPIELVTLPSRRLSIETEERLESTEEDTYSAPASPAMSPGVAHLSNQSPATGPLAAIRHFWAEYISVIVDFDTCRDHLGRSKIPHGLIYLHLFSTPLLEERYSSPLFTISFFFITLALLIHTPS
jgi:hypothetical protein